ncbi:TPA: hypothetical protein KQG29_001522 [Clostridioides difficile]|nr:hypothetical protein [Clostridioides difficile]
MIYNFNIKNGNKCIVHLEINKQKLDILKLEIDDKVVKDTNEKDVYFKYIYDDINKENRLYIVTEKLVARNISKLLKIQQSYSVNILVPKELEKEYLRHTI